MSRVVFNGRTFAAGLTWAGRADFTARASQGLRGRATDHVRLGSQTGYGRRGDRGLPSLAGSLLAHAQTQGIASWMALLEDDDDGACAGAVCEDGYLLADGDRVFVDREEALEWIGRVRAADDARRAVFVTAGLATALREAREDPEASLRVLDPDDLPSGAELELRPLPLTAARVLPWARWAAGVMLLAFAGVWLWSERESIMAWLFPEPLPAPVPGPLPEAPRARVVLTGAALLSACEAVLAMRPPVLPGWDLEETVCLAALDREAVTAALPVLAGRPALVLHWRAQDGPAALWRRMAERTLTGWQASGSASETATGWVLQDEAFVVLPLGPALSRRETPPPDFLSFRRVVDARAGLVVEDLRYAETASREVDCLRIGPASEAGDGPGRPGYRQPPGWAVSFASGLPLARLRDIAARVPDLEIVEASRDAAGTWSIKGRLAEPVTVLEEVAAALQRGEGDWTSLSRPLCPPLA